MCCYEPIARIKESGGSFNEEEEDEDEEEEEKQKKKKKKKKKKEKRDTEGMHCFKGL